MNDCKNCKYTDEYCASGDCNEIQANDLACNKISLTEQWKKGELPEGFYYIKCDWSDEVEIRYVHNGVDDWKAIFAKVPSYDEWFKIKNLASLSECLQEKNIECLHRENKLKELLKEVKDYLPEYETPMDILAKIDEVLK